MVQASIYGRMVESSLILGRLMQRTQPRTNIAQGDHGPPPPLPPPGIEAQVVRKDEVHLAAAMS